MRQLVLLAAAAVLSLAVGPCAERPRLRFVEPPAGELRLASDPVGFHLELPADADAATLELRVDGTPVVPDSLQVDDGLATGALAALPEGSHVIAARVATADGSVDADTWVELVNLEHPDQCEVLNAIHCMLPYPSSAFLREADTETGFALDLPPDGMPEQFGRRLSVAPFAGFDGFSPTVQVMMHFGGDVDLDGPGVPRLRPDRRMTDLTSLEAGSATLLIDAETGERVLHWIENDIGQVVFQGTPIPVDPARRFTFLRPAQSLLPNRHYIVAVRHLRRPDGSPVRAEPVFAALRDGRPSAIPGVEARRPGMEAIFARLEELGVAREDLQLAFDFRTRSDTQLTSQMLSMRDQAFDWLDGQVESGTSLFDVESVEENDCSVDGEQVWRVVKGTYRVPLFLGADPETQNFDLAFLVTDAEGVPQMAGETRPRFGISIPCSALAGAPVHPLLWGHGLFGDGTGDVDGIVANVGQLLEDWEIGNGLAYVTGATRWRGLSSPDITPPTGSSDIFQTWLVRQVLIQLDHFQALPDRLRQGQLNTLVLARMMKRGLFNVDPAFQLPGGDGVFPGVDEEMYYFGASLGGIMGLMFAGLSPDVVKHNVDVPGINFSLLLQRATPFLQFEELLAFTGITDNIDIALGIGLLHEQWVVGEPAAVIRHVTHDPLPGVPEKQILLTVAYLDQQVSNTASEVAARTLRIPQLEGSLYSDRNVPKNETLPGPLRSAWVVYDTASFELDDPNDQPFIPPLGNDQAQPSGCDPHGRRAFTPASLQQLAGFLRPDDPGDPAAGRIVNFCDGLCDADLGAVRTLSDGSDLRFEIPFNDTARCQP